MDSNYQYHHSIRKRFGESLCYFFVALGPTYDRPKVVRVLIDLFEREDIKARALFEVYGEVDFIIRAWIPGPRLSDFSEVLQEFLSSRGCGVKRIEQFTSASNPYHWLFSDEPKPKARLPGDNADYLDKISVNEVNSAFVGEAPTVLDNLRSLHLAKPAVKVSGIRFFVAIPSPGEGLSSTLINGLISDIAKTVGSQAQILNAALYRGVTGQKIGALLEGIVGVGNYSGINEAVSAINDDTGLERFSIKTVTYLATEPSENGQEGLGAVSSATSIIDPKDIRDRSYYLGMQEGELFERKGTFEIDVNRVLATGELKKNPQLIKEVLETIVAFLNTHGGEVLIGALEPDKFRGEMRTALDQKFPIEGPGEAPLSICGVNWEFSLVAKEPTWEAYESHIRELCAARISETVNDFIKIYPLPSTEPGRDLCLIRVQALPIGEFAYYEEDGFFTRQGPSTKPLRGRAREDYQRRRRRRDL